MLRYFWRDANEELGATFFPETVTFLPVPPESLNEQMLTRVCSFTGKLADAKTAGLLFPSEPDTTAKLKRVVNPDDYYPFGSQRRGEQGSPVVRACVGPDGALLREPVITDSSGYPALDDAAIKVAKGNRYSAGTKDGAALPESCIKYKVKFSSR